MTMRLHNKSGNEKKKKTRSPTPASQENLSQEEGYGKRKKYEISCDFAQSWVNSLSIHLAGAKNP